MFRDLSPRAVHNPEPPTFREESITALGFGGLWSRGFSFEDFINEPNGQEGQSHSDSTHHEDFFTCRPQPQLQQYEMQQSELQPQYASVIQQQTYLQPYQQQQSDAFDFHHVINAAAAGRCVENDSVAERSASAAAIVSHKCYLDNCKCSSFASSQTDDQLCSLCRHGWGVHYPGFEMQDLLQESGCKRSISDSEDDSHSEVGNISSSTSDSTGGSKKKQKGRQGRPPNLEKKVPKKSENKSIVAKQRKRDLGRFVKRDPGTAPITARNPRPTPRPAVLLLQPAMLGYYDADRLWQVGAAVGVAQCRLPPAGVEIEEEVITSTSWV